MDVEYLPVGKLKIMSGPKNSSEKNVILKAERKNIDNVYKRLSFMRIITQCVRFDS
jgi:hypothetical protein